MTTAGRHADSCNGCHMHMQMMEGHDSGVWCRFRVWDNLYSANEPPDRQIVHSHDFNRSAT